VDYERHFQQYQVNFPSTAQPGRLYATGPREWQWHANELFISDDAGLSWRRSGLKASPAWKSAAAKL
jgi:hypothetical protein